MTLQYPSEFLFWRKVWFFAHLLDVASREDRARITGFYGALLVTARSSWECFLQLWKVGISLAYYVGSVYCKRFTGFFIGNWIMSTIQCVWLLTRKSVFMISKVSLPFVCRFTRFSSSDLHQLMTSRERFCSDTGELDDGRKTSIKRKVIYQGVWISFHSSSYSLKAM